MDFIIVCKHSCSYTCRLINLKSNSSKQIVELTPVSNLFWIGWIYKRYETTYLHTVIKSIIPSDDINEENMFNVKH